MEQIRVSYFTPCNQYKEKFFNNYNSAVIYAKKVASKKGYYLVELRLFRGEQTFYRYFKY